MKTLDLIKAAVDRSPDSAAYVSNGVSITYRELWFSACRFASLIGGGSAPAIVYGAKEAYMPEAMLGCLIAGRAYVPADRGIPAARFKKMISISGADTVIGNRIPVIDGIRRIDPPAADGRSDFTPLPAKESDLAYIIFTSGTTGDPKGVRVTRANLDNFVCWITSLDPLCSFSGARVLNIASFSFDLSVADLYYSLCKGHTLYASHKADDALDLLRAREINVAVSTPTTVKYFLLDPDFNAERLPSLRCLYFCGERLDPRTVRKIFSRFPEISVINAYGPTEATSAVCATSVTPEMCDLAALPAGDVENAACCIRIENGEIVIEGKSVFAGYAGQDESGGIHRTGDRGEIRDGRLFCLGRLDRQIKYKGFRIELDDIEANAASLDGVRSCAAVCKRGPDGSVKHLRLFTEGDARSEDIRLGLSALLPAYMIPSEITVIPSLPCTGNGKIDRKALELL